MNSLSMTIFAANEAAKELITIIQRNNPSTITVI